MSEFRDPSNQQLKQINSAAKPLYTPAVLRTTFERKEQAERPSLAPRPSSASVASSVSSYWQRLGASLGLSRETEREEDGPSREHWKPDSSRFSCANCGRIFNYLTQTRSKHHCRACGDLFCGQCLLNYIYLDDQAQFTVFGPDWGDDAAEEQSKHLCKVCRSCYLKYEEYVLDHTTRDHDLGAETQTKVREGRRGTVVDNLQDMPVDWDWSSF